MPFASPASFYPQITALANHERQKNKLETRVNTSQHGNWQNFRNAEYQKKVAERSIYCDTMAASVKESVYTTPHIRTPTD